MVVACNNNLRSIVKVLYLFLETEVKWKWFFDEREKAAMNLKKNHQSTTENQQIQPMHVTVGHLVGNWNWDLW